MSLVLKTAGSNDFEITPEGLHEAVCFKVVDLGMQATEYNGEKKEQQKLRLGFQIPAERVNIDGKGLPAAIFKTFTASLHSKGALRPFLESWRGKKFDPESESSFDIGKLLGVCCQLQVIHNKVGDKTYANIQTIVPLKPFNKLKPENDAFIFDYVANYNNFEKLSKYEQETVQKAPEFQTLLSKEDFNFSSISEGETDTEANNLPKNNKPPF